MTERFRVHEWVKYNYSEIGEYTDENHTDKPLRNDELVELLNELYEENRELKRINMICEEQISELRRLVHIANDWISDDKKEEWKKELMRE